MGETDVLEKDVALVRAHARANQKSLGMVALGRAHAHANQKSHKSVPTHTQVALTYKTLKPLNRQHCNFQDHLTMRGRLYEFVETA